MIAVSLSDARQDQVARLLKELQTGELPAGVVCVLTTPRIWGSSGDRRAHRFSIAVSHERIRVTTPWAQGVTGAPPEEPAARYPHGAHPDRAVVRS